MSIILKAAKLASRYHHGQFRKFAESTPYLVHPMRVAGWVCLLVEVTEAMVAAAWLHDVLEDTGCTREIITHECGGEAAELVFQLTNQKVAGLTREEQKQCDRERLAKVSREAKLIKFCDRTDNLMDCPPGAWRVQYARESIRLCDALVYSDNGLSGHQAAKSMFMVADKIVKGEL